MSAQTTARTLDGYTLDDIVKALTNGLRPEMRDMMQDLEEPASFVPETAVKTYKAFADYPDVLQAKHCRAILGLSEAKTYEVLNSKKCPSFTVGKRILVRKEAFIQFLLDNEGQDLID